MPLKAEVVNTFIFRQFAATFVFNRKENSVVIEQVANSDLKFTK